MRLLGATVVAASMLGAACLSIPPYTPTSLVSYDKDNSVVNGGDFSLHFASGSAFHFPDGLEIDHSSNLLGRDDASLCYDESGAGFSLYPAPRISADTTAMMIRNDLTAVWNGPAVVQIQVDWETQFACNRARTPQGTSTFTVFPDGRIVRHDRLGDSNPIEISASNCSCSDAPGTLDEFIIESYWTFARSYQSSNNLADNPPQPEAIPTERNASKNMRALCLDYGSYQLASLQVAQTSTDGSAQIFGTDRVGGHRLQQPIGNSSLKDLSWEITSALFIEHGGCVAAANRVNAYSSPPMVAINGVSVPASPLDGVYGSAPGSDGKPGVLLPGGRGTLQAQAVPFAVWLRFLDPIDGVRALLPGMTGEWYTPQRIDDHNWIVWFQNNALAMDRPIQLEPL